MKDLGSTNNIKNIIKGVKRNRTSIKVLTVPRITTLL